MIYTTRTIAQVLLAVMALLAAGCGSHDPETLSQDLTTLKARVAPVRLITEGRDVQIYGIVQPARQSSVSSRVMGPVVAVHVNAGDRVRAGQRLVEIQPAASKGQLAQAEGALAQARAALSLAERNLKRYQALHEEKAASDVELDMATMQYEQARGAVRQAEGAVQAASSVADEATVAAPFAARVVERLVEVGDMAAPGRPLVRVQSLSGREIWLTVREADIGLLEQGQTLKVRLDSRSDLGLIDGTVDEIVPTADPATHTFTVKVELDGVDIPSGISGRATVPGEVVERLAIPLVAVHQRGGLELAVVQAADGTARTRAVTTGQQLSEGLVEILSGLRADDSVVLDAPGPVADGTPLEVSS